MKCSCNIWEDWKTIWRDCLHLPMLLEQLADITTTCYKQVLGNIQAFPPSVLLCWEPGYPYIAQNNLNLTRPGWPGTFSSPASIVRGIQVCIAHGLFVKWFLIFSGINCLLPFSNKTKQVKVTQHPNVSRLVLYPLSPLSSHRVLISPLCAGHRGNAHFLSVSVAYTTVWL